VNTYLQGFSERNSLPSPAMPLPVDEIPGIEMDSAETEDVVDLRSLLLPPGFEPLATLDAVIDKFSISYSKR